VPAIGFIINGEPRPELSCFDPNDRIDSRVEGFAAAKDIDPYTIFLDQLTAALDRIRDDIPQKPLENLRGKKWLAA
jgi:hypothetical protein